MSASEWTEWNPPGFPHVTGSYLPREEDEPQKVRAKCSKCRMSWQGECATGAVRTKIMKFAVIHAHSDPFASPA